MKRILTAVLGLALLAAPAAAFARGGGGGQRVVAADSTAAGRLSRRRGLRRRPRWRHGGGFHAAAPYGAFHGPAVRGAPGIPRPVRRRSRPGRRVQPIGGRIYVPGYWGFSGGVSVWIGPSWTYAPYSGWNWVAAHWAWNGYTWVWQEGYWAPPAY